MRIYIYLCVTTADAVINCLGLSLFLSDSPRLPTRSPVGPFHPLRRLRRGEEQERFGAPPRSIPVLTRGD